MEKNSYLLVVYDYVRDFVVYNYVGNFMFCCP
jgi:hypothetical protein